MEHKNQQNINISNSSDVKIGDISLNVNSKGENKVVAKSEIIPKIRELKEKLSKNKLKEVIDSLLEEFSLEKDTQNHLYNIAYRLNSINDKVSKDIIDFNTATIEKNKIASSLLEIIDEIKK